MRAGRREGAAQQFQEFFIGRIIRPQREDSARMQMCRQRAQTIRFIERRIARVEQFARGVIDIE
jgi:hypothetical protein